MKVMAEQEVNSTLQSLYWVLSVFFLLIIFVVDYCSPLGIAIGSIYVLPVFFAIFLIESPHGPILFSLMSSILIVAGYFLSEQGNSTELTVLVNRVLSIFVSTSGAYAATKLKNSYKKLGRFVRMLQQSNEDLEAFAYVASHDLKSPLRAIDNLANWIAEDCDLNSDAKEHQKKLKLRVRRMEDLLDSLLAYSRLDKLSNKIGQVDCNILVNKIFESLDRPKEFKLFIPKILPILSTPMEPIDLIFRNLISNAVKHRKDDNGIVTITFNNNNSKFFSFSVKDNGKGIPVELHEKAFGMFQTLQSRDQVEGTGMGLAFVRKIVSRYGGGVKIDSDSSVGCSLTFLWPKNIKI